MGPTGHQSECSSSRRNKARLSNLVTKEIDGMLPPKEMPDCLSCPFQFHQRKDDRLCRPVDREIWMLLTHRDGFNLKPRNPIGVPTHKDGAVLDHCLSHHAMNISVHVASNRQLLNSDRYPLILAWNEATNTCSFALQLGPLPLHNPLKCDVG